MMRAVVAEPPRQEQRQEHWWLQKGLLCPTSAPCEQILEAWEHRMHTGTWDSSADTGRAVRMETSS